MRRLTLALTAALLLTACASKQINIAIQYGKVEQKKLVNERSSLDQAKRAGYRGALDMPGTESTAQMRRNNIDRVRQGLPEYLYSIRTADDKTLRVITEKSFFEISDCVAIEKGKTLNLRLVSDEICRRTRQEKSVVMLSELKATQCELAKRQLLIAQTERQLNAANNQVTGLCQFSREQPN